MRLLNVWDLKFTVFWEISVPRYVIASHRWVERAETSLDDIRKKRKTKSSGYIKVLNLARFIHTCCINHDSSQEVTEGINSMFRWYRNASLCLAYLADVPDASDEAAFLRSSWFRRGWTLQELIAPDCVIFIAADWQVIGHTGGTVSTRGTLPLCAGQNLTSIVASITGIRADVIDNAERCKGLSARVKAQWTTGRETTRGEDMAYCLMGLMGVSMTVIYGEGGIRAKQRLLRKVAKTGEVLERTDIGAVRGTSLSGTLKQTIFLIASSTKHDQDRKTSSDNHCLDEGNVDEVFVGSYKGVAERIKAFTTSARRLGPNMTDTLRRRPNESYESRWRLYIYTAACRWHLDLGLNICAHIIGFNGFMRIDPILVDGCCRTSADAGIVNLKTAIDRVNTSSSSSTYWKDRYSLLSHFDVPWLQSRAAGVKHGSELRDQLTLSRYLDLAEEDVRVSAVVVISTPEDIRTLLNSVEMEPRPEVQDDQVYKVDYRADTGLWHAKLFCTL